VSREEIAERWRDIPRTQLGLPRASPIPPPLAKPIMAAAKIVRKKFGPLLVWGLGRSIVLMREEIGGVPGALASEISWLTSRKSGAPAPVG
jgi:hypothetical protein